MKSRVALILVLFSPFLVSAQTTNVALQTQIEALLEQIKVLQVKIAELQGGAQVKVVSTRILRLGMSGEDVRVLQTFLRQFPTLYPEGLVTGYFGTLTESAVKRFQAKYGIVSGGTPQATGYGQVGPRTLIKMNEIGTSSGLATVPSLTKQMPIGVNTANIAGTLGTSTGAYFLAGNAGASSGAGAGGASPPPPSPSPTPPSPPPSPGSPPDTTAPTISNVSSGLITTTGATITWTTNESSNSKVVHSTNSGLTNPTNTTNGSNVTSHSVALTGLTQSTTYYYAVVSADASGNYATSSTSSFTTAAPDTTAPTVTAISVTIQPDRVSLSWNTNEEATGILYIDTSPSINLSNALKFTTTDINNTHRINDNIYVGDENDGPLDYQTTYYFLFSSRDTSGNTSTTTSSSYDLATRYWNCAPRTESNPASLTFTTEPDDDETAPVFSNFQETNITSNSATISWTATDSGILPNGYGEIGYGLTSYAPDPQNGIYPYVVTPSLSGSAPTYSVSGNLTGLAPNTRYYYRVSYEDLCNNQTDSAEQTFKTHP